MSEKFERHMKASHSSICQFQDEIREQITRIERLQLLNDDAEDNVRASKRKHEQEMRKLTEEKQQEIDELKQEVK